MSVAVISLGGKQYTVAPGNIIHVPHLSNRKDNSLILTDLLHGQKVSAKVLDDHKGNKIRVVKFKNKTRYTRVIGHRTITTKLQIETIEPQEPKS